MPIERIVAATDFSDASARALRRAALLAAERRVPLHLVTVSARSWLGELRGWLAGARIRASAAALEAALAELAQELQQAHAIEIRSAVLKGDARIELARHAAAVGAGVLVLGARGRSLVGEIALGSTALALLERCAVPLLMVRGEARQPYGKVLAGVAFEPAAREAIRTAAALAPQADFTFAHAYEDPFAAELFLGQASDDATAHYRERARLRAQRELEHFAGELGSVGAHTERRLVHGSPGVQLVQLAGQLGADLVVLGARRRPGRAAAMLGSVAASVALMVASDVLLVRERARAR